MSQRNKFLTNQMIAKISVLGVLAFLIMFLETPLGFAPSFYKMDLSEVVVLLGGFALGPAAAASIEAMKIVLNLLFTGTQTSFVGEIANYIMGISLVFPAIWIYRRNKTKKTAVIGLIAGTISLTIVGTAMNYFVLLPAYSYFFHLPMDTLLSMGSQINGAITDRLTFVLFATAPFNLLKGILCSVITILLYKRVSPLLKAQSK
ncbi:MAG: ECF transporter S component [Erysipelotrichaceae bacterium]|nr:ECF transporter S component [Erysipelotrichaceae bacterium]